MNVFHKDFTLDNNHALNARAYADLAARDADAAFNTNAANIDKIARINSPVSYYILTDTNPTWQELTNVTAGDVTTSDTLLATQLLVGNGGKDIVTEPDLIWNGLGFGIGITPVSRLHVYENTAFGGPSGGLTIEQDGTGDAMLHFVLTAGTRWITGIDVDQSDAFKIQPNNTFNDATGLTMTTGGNVGLGIVNPVGKLHLFGTIGDELPFVTYSQVGINGGSVHDFFGSRDPEGLITALTPGDFYHRFSGVNSGLFIFKGAATGNTGWEEVHTSTSGSGVTTSDVLAATQLLLGNSGVDIVTEPDLTYDGSLFSIAGAGGLDLALASTLSFNSVIILDDDVGGMTLSNIDQLDPTTKTTIENAILTLPNLGSVGTISGAITGPSGEWNGGGFDVGPNDSYAVNGVDVISDAAGTITLSNINVLDATTETTIESAIDALPNIGTLQGLTVAYADAGADAVWGWDDVGSTYRNLTPAEVNAITGGVTTSDVLIANQLLLGNGGVDIVTEPDLVWDGAMFGIGITDPVSRLHVFENTIFTGPSAGLTLEQMGTGDVMLQFLLTTGMRWIMGMDNSDGDSFKINDAVNFSTSGAITILASTELIGLGTNAPDTRLDVSDNGGDALRLRSGNATGNALNQIKMSLDGGLLHTHAIKTLHHATNQFNNAIEFYLWDPDEDTSGEVGTLKLMRIQGDGKIGVNKDPAAILDITSDFSDGTPVITIESGSSSGTTDFRTGNRDPNGMVSGIGPDVYFADRGALSASYESRSVSTDQVWLKRSVLPANILQLLNSTQLDDLASAGVITIAVNTTWHIRGALTTANRIVINAGIVLNITGEFNNTSITYSGTLTFVSGSGALRTWAQMSLISTSTGTFLDIDGGSGINLTESSIIGWDDLGTIANTGFLTSQSRYLNIGIGLTLTNTFLVNASVILLIGAPLNGPLFIINNNNPVSVLSFIDVQGNALSATGSLFDLDTRINNNVSIKVNGCSARAGNLYKQSVLTDATINSVADGSIATGTITAMADNGSGGTTISSTTTYFEDEEVTITGTTSYNGTFQIFNVVAGVSFDTITTFVADDATGSVDTVRLTLTLAGGHGIITGDSIKIIDTNFYNGFKTTLNVATNDITVNGVFVSTNTGSIERELSLDQTDRRVSAFRNFGFVDSHSIATAHVNDNSTATGTIVNNTFTDMVFGTAANALLANSTMERWQLVDELNGTFEHIGQEPFDGSITFDFTVESAGGTVDFRFKWLIDRGAGFVDLPDTVESLVAVGSDAESVTKTFPLLADNSDLIKPQITRNSGASGITSTHATIYVSE